MGPFDSLRKRVQANPPAATDTFQSLDRRPDQPARRVKTGRTEQFNIRVRAGFKKRVTDLAAAEQITTGNLFEKMLADYESGASRPEHGVPLAEAQAGRVRALRLWATDPVFDAIALVAAERRMTLSALIEDLLAREVARLNPHGGKFGVNVRKRNGAR
jgi:hypothetical protein